MSTRQRTDIGLGSVVKQLEQIVVLDASAAANEEAAAKKARGQVENATQTKKKSSHERWGSP